MRRRQQLITVWTGQQATLVCQDRDLRNEGDLNRVSLSCDPFNADNYRERVQMMLDTRLKSVEFIWILVKETFPYSSFDEQSCEWIINKNLWFRAVCESLTSDLIPQSVYSGLHILKAAWSQNEDIWKPGYGVYQEIADKGFVICYGEDESFVRVSRKPLDGDGSPSIFRSEWLQQTRMLYRNRTGFELKKLFSQAEFPVKPDVEDDDGMVIGSLPFGEDDALFCNDLPLPTNVVLSLLKPNSQLKPVALDVLNKRECRRQQLRGLKSGSALLILGVLILFVGACRGDLSYGSDRNASMDRWDDTIVRWERSMEKWHLKAASLKNRRLGILLAGSIGANLPEPVQLRRLQVQKASFPENPIDVFLEGEIKSVDDSGIFQAWVDSLVDEGVLDEVRNIEYEPGPNNLTFQLHAKSSGGTSQ